MEDKILPPEGLSGAGTAQPVEFQRRAFLRRAVGVGVPVVLATVRGRSVLAQGNETTALRSGCASTHFSGWLGEGRNSEADLNERELNCTAEQPSFQPGGGADDGSTDELSKPQGGLDDGSSDPLSKPQGGKDKPKKLHGSSGS